MNVSNGKTVTEEGKSHTDIRVAHRAAQDLRAVLVLALEVTFKIPVSGRSLCQALGDNVQLEDYQNCRISSFPKQLPYSCGLCLVNIDHSCRRPLR